MARLRSGDRQAFETLVRRHAGVVYRFVARFTRPGPRAEELTQEVFRRVAEQAASFEPEAAFSAWLHGVTRGVCFAAMARKTEGLTVEGERGVEGEGDAAARARGSVGQVVAEGDEDERVQRAMAGLGDEQREVFLLCEMQGMPFWQIAAVTGVSEEMVKSLMRSALEQFARGMQGTDEASR